MLVLGSSAPSDLHATLAALVLGLVIGVFGHIIRSRAMILIGIIIIAVVSAYFSFVLQPHGG
jgi:hypothetical protein